MNTIRMIAWLRRTSMTFWTPVAAGYGMVWLGNARSWPGWGTLLAGCVVTFWLACRGRRARKYWRSSIANSWASIFRFSYRHYVKPVFWIGLFIGTALLQQTLQGNWLDGFETIGSMSIAQRRWIGQEEFKTAGSVFLFCGFFYLYATLGAVDRYVHVRGPILLSEVEAKGKIDALRPVDDPGLNCTGMRLPTSFQKHHQLFVGVTGSGKSTLFNAELQSVFDSHVRRRQGKVRALVYDAKQDSLSTLAGMPLPGPLYILNPFDARGVGFAIAKDATDFGVIAEFASIFVPASNSSQPYFDDAARDMVRGLMVSFAECTPGLWTLRDLMLGIETPEAMCAIWERSPYTRGLIPMYTRPESTFASVRSTLATHLAPLRIVAACWHRARHHISLGEWVCGESVLVLGSDDARKSAIMPINRVIMQRLSELLLAKADCTDDRTWLMLDEARELGKLPGLHSLLVRGRSKGCTVVLGFQDIEGYRDAVGEKLAHEIVSQCGIKTFLRIASDKTAQWASQQFGEFERRERMFGSSSSGGKSTSSWNEHLAKRDLILPSEFQNLPLGDFAKGFEGFNIVPDIGNYRSSVSPKKLRQLLPVNAAFPNVVPRPPEHMKLLPWTKDDLDRLKLPHRLLHTSAMKPQQLRPRRIP